ncbi:MAG: hypothetical protein COT80_01070 [Candidatus Buchananbacteria bacterium CG10_big_fil_rev_8_21_14_0_10_33_19]|uniref:Uncharacterized protein n=1 Tax=Candidatus Buchananbacteria bacterium CG10_big_fil_rev_8_21_14_0_10_33_19 TaxID=1974525 RepID=A0A2H0W468_9BACT|nr:MAG: hypothetical protein COT80_01070 [Candidatus Buchananbacteria bacterium CG10_big_fil_rev_8_21_14_0_10_33_19]
MFINCSQKYRLTNKAPYNSELILKIQQERDFAISQSINQKLGYKIFEIIMLSDEHFKKIIAKKEATKKPPG